MFRTLAGVVHVLDAYCPHLGANMAVGGAVRGDCIECPFHGWRFKGEDGKCTVVPYSEKGEFYTFKFHIFQSHHLHLYTLYLNIWAQEG